MRTVNTVTLLGNVARSPEMRMTSHGKNFATFVIATHKDSLRDGEKVTVPEFHNIVVWGNLANIAENFCTKGRLVYIEGYLKTRSWEHENGAKIFRTEIVANNIIALNASGHPEHEGDDSIDKEKEGAAGDDDSFFSATKDDFFASS